MWQPPAGNGNEADPMPPLDNVTAAEGQGYWAGAASLSTFDFPPLLNGLVGDGLGFDFGLWPDMLGPYGTAVVRPQGMGVGELDEQHMY